MTTFVNKTNQKTLPLPSTKTPTPTETPATGGNPVRRSSNQWQNIAMIGSGYVVDGLPFINIGFDRDVNYEELADYLNRGMRLSLQPLKKEDSRSPQRKYVLVLRAPAA